MLVLRCGSAADRPAMSDRTVPARRTIARSTGAATHVRGAMAGRDQSRRLLHPAHDPEAGRRAAGARFPDEGSRPPVVDYRHVHVRGWRLLGARAEHVRTLALRATAGAEVGGARVPALLFLLRSRRLVRAPCIRSRRFAADRCVCGGVRRDARVRVALVRRAAFRVRGDPDDGTLARDLRGGPEHRQRHHLDGRTGRHRISCARAAASRPAGSTCA